MAHEITTYQQIKYTMKTEPKNYTVRDGIIRRYEQLTIREAGLNYEKGIK